MKNYQEKDNNMMLYTMAIENSNYGAMYNKYNVLLFAEHPETISKA